MLNVIFFIVVTLGVTTLLVSLSKRYGPSIIIGTFSGLIVMSQIFAGKLVVFGPFTVPGAVILYATTYLLTDALNEFYSKSEANKAVLSGFISSIILVVGVQLVMMWEPAPFWPYQAEFELILSNTWRITLASILSYAVSQTFDVWSYDKIRQLTKGKHMWLRNNLSTLGSQFFDTIIFIGIAFSFTMPFASLLSMMVGQYLIKLLIAFLDTPFLYLLRYIYYGSGGKEETVKANTPH